MDKLKEISSEFRDFSRWNQPIVVALVVIVLLFAIFLFIYKRFAVVLAQRREIERLFGSLARSSGLSEAEQDLLLDMAEAYDLKNPAVLFVAPSLIAGFSQREESRRRYRDAGELQTRIRALSEKLFAR